LQERVFFPTFSKGPVSRRPVPELFSKEPVSRDLREQFFEWTRAEAREANARDGNTANPIPTTFGRRQHGRTVSELPTVEARGRRLPKRRMPSTPCHETTRAESARLTQLDQRS